MNHSKLTPIGEAAKLLGVSIDTLRRWDKIGRLQSVRSSPRGHRFYLSSDLEQLFMREFPETMKECAKNND